MKLSSATMIASMIVAAACGKNRDKVDPPPPSAFDSTATVVLAAPLAKLIGSQGRRGAAVTSAGQAFWLDLKTPELPTLSDSITEGHAVLVGIDGDLAAVALADGSLTSAGMTLTAPPCDARS